MTKYSIWQRTATLITSGIMAAFGFTGMAAAATVNTITNTGPDSTNIITNTETNTCVITNINDIDIDSASTQTAVSGDATVSNNTSGGSAVSGSAVNTNTEIITVIIGEATVEPPVLSNPLTNDDPCDDHLAGGQGSGVISTTGPGSANTIQSGKTNNTFRLKSNDVRFGKVNRQAAGSGRVIVYANTGGGGAVSGPAANHHGGSAAVSTATAPSGGQGGGGAPAPTVAARAGSTNTISNTGPSSTNTISNSTTNSATVTNVNTVSSYSTNTQTASSGSASVTDNTSAGSGVTGTASNTSSTSTTVRVSS